LDAAVGEDGATMIELVADPDPVDPWRTLQQREIEREVASMIDVLPLRHRDVLRRRYGLHGCRRQSHEEIGRSLGVGEARTRQLEREALNRLREFGAERLRAA
jgi:DNA-directed RNA polymerase sigma subunit (sigma70/sigma32)